MKRLVALIAPTGMLGSMVYSIFKDKYNLILIYRDEKKLEKLNKIYGGIDRHKRISFNFDRIYEDYKEKSISNDIYPGKRTRELVEKIGEVDTVINCAGIIIPYALVSPLNTFFINGALPNILSSIYKEKLIHITTDCVFDGISGAPYHENSLKNPRDIYGLSKSLGEPEQHSLILRTSIIGPEISQYNSLLEWTKVQEGKTIDGYTNHLWNGVTTKQLAIILSDIIDNRSNSPSHGLFHLFTNDISKYDLLTLIKQRYNLRVSITPKEVNPVDRRLSSVFDYYKKFNIPTIQKMIENL